MEVRLINSAIVSLSIDGYKVSNPIGFKGSELVLQFYTAFAPLVHISAIEKVCAELNLDLVAVAVEPTRYTAWGGSTLKIDTLAPSKFIADEMAQKMLKEALDYPTVSAVAFWPVSQRVDNDLRQDRMNTAGLIDPLDLVEVIRDGDKSLAHITSVSHDITPYTWKTTLTLLPKEVIGFEDLFTGPNRAR